MNKKALWSILLALVVLFSIAFLYNRYRIAPALESEQIRQVMAKPEIWEEGKTTILIWMASWCKDCRAKLPEINAFIQKYPTGSYQLIGLSDESDEVIAQWTSQQTFLFPLVHSKKRISDMGIHVIPTLYVFDKKGKRIYSRVLHFLLNDPALIALIDK